MLDSLRVFSHMDRAYNPQQIEAKWQRVWAEQQTFRVTEDSSRPKFYCLEMFPYPSGRIHMGHVRNYAIGDVLARFKIMRGYNVLHPMGWDAFGLPAENAAIEQGVHPAAWTTENIRYMRNQLERLGISYDWSREINTCEPDYYKWNQWFFLKFYEKGLAYRKRSAVNWCPSCETVLANEQVEEGRCWRCESVVVQKELEQWFFRITAYAEELLTGCDRLPAWPTRVLTMQRNWIGKSIGVEVDFPLAEPLSDLPAIRIFTTRQDTIFGATFMSLAPESPLVERLVEGRPEAKAVREFVARVSRQEKALRTAPDRVKEGVFTGACAVNPFTLEPIPIWVANFVLYEYGTGAIMAVPAHDQRDFEFANTYGIPVRLVIQNPEGTLREPLTAAYEEQTGTLVNSGQFSGLPVAEGKERIADFIETCGMGARTVNYRLRDWGISRQRYWGTPIPIIYCQKCGTVPVPEADLPVMLPKDVPFTGKGASPLAQAEAFVKTTCPKCKGPARRENDAAGGSREGGSVDGGGPVHRRDRACGPASALRPFLHQSRARPGAGESGRAVYEPADARHGLHGNLPLRGARLAVADRSQQGRVALQTVRETGRARPRREDVEVQEEHRGPGTFDRGVRRGHGAPLLPLCGAAGEGPGVEQRGRGGRVPLPGAGVEASARLGPAAQAIEWRPRRRRQPDG